VSGVSLETGWLPAVLAVLALAAGVFLVLRRRPWWWLWVVPAVIGAAVIGAWIIGRFVAERLFAEPLPMIVSVWIGVIVAGVGLAIGHQFDSPWWDKVLAALAAVAVVVAAGNEINQLYEQYPTVGDLFGPAGGDQIAGPPPFTPSAAGLPAGPLSTNWTPTGIGIPAEGKVSQIDLPGTRSGFPGRQGWVYYPPAYFADNPQPLPVLVLLTGQPGNPDGWFLGDRVQNVMNDFARQHNGIAPIVVSPDPLGSELANPLCANSSLGQVDTYLSQDVPTAIRRQLRVQSQPRAWSIGGFSYGGTCAIQMATNHPDVYPTFIDISGQLEPTLGTHQQTVDTAFAGNESAFAAINPMNIMASKKFPNTAGWFLIGGRDLESRMQQQQQVYLAAKAAGMRVFFWQNPGSSHEWGTAVAGLAHVVPWLAGRLNITPAPLEPRAG